jgi:hypothetical protein
MKTAKLPPKPLCVCDAMIAKTRGGDTKSYSSVWFRDMMLSWECPTHGKVTVDHRKANHIHPPAVVHVEPERNSDLESFNREPRRPIKKRC